MKHYTTWASCSFLQLAFFVFVAAILSACAANNNSSNNMIADLPTEVCQQSVTSIAAIQGVGKSSPFLGQQHTVRGVVTHLIAGSGLYLEQNMADMDPLSSDGIYISNDLLSEQIKPGDIVQLSGVVAELNGKNNNGGMTSLEQITISGFCGHAQPLPVHANRLPLSAAERESLEAMNLEINQELTVSDLYQLYKRQQLSLSANGLPFVATEVITPGELSAEHAARNRANNIDLQLDNTSPSIEKTTAFGVKQVGDQVFSLSGVMSQAFGRYRLIATEELQFSQHKEADLPKITEALRVMGFNLHNYFNGDGLQGGFPTDRGAKSYADFNQQRSRLVNAIKVSGADIVAVEEIENDGYGPQSAIADLTRALNQAMPGAEWGFSKPVSERLGADVISVGILYRGARVKALGLAVSTKHKAFRELSRQPLAQHFIDLNNGGELLLAINHFKSKGSCPTLAPGTDVKSTPNANQRDGQGCWNLARQDAAVAVADWLNSLHNISSVANILMLGDLNSYRKEDPIISLKTRGWSEMVEAFASVPPFSFIYRGQAGTLDYAFASPELKDKVKAAWIWKINSTYSPDHPWLENDYHRSSDHDPVIVDIQLANP